MAIVTPDGDGVSDYTNASDWLVVYQGTKLMLFGQYIGNTTLKGTIEYFDTEEEALTRVAELNLEDTFGFLAEE